MIGDRDIGRIEAFSDGVIAIIITIMVLEIHPPEAPTWEALSHLWPTLLGYVLSFAYVAIYWVNHQRLVGFAPRFSVGLHWANMLLLFTLSLVPISTGWMGRFPLTTVPTATYLITLILPAAAWMWLDAEVLKLKGADAAPKHVIHAEQIKQIGSFLIYGSGIVLAFVHPAIALLCAALVSLIWFVPDGPIDRLLTRFTHSRHK